MTKVDRANKIYIENKDKPYTGCTYSYATWWVTCVNAITGVTPTRELLNEISNFKEAGYNDLSIKHRKECTSKNYNFMFIWHIIAILDTKYDKRTRKFKLKQGGKYVQ